MSRVIQRSGLVLMALIVALLLAELGLRLLAPIPAQHLLPFAYRHDALRSIAGGDSYIRFDAELGWTTARASVHQDGGVVYRTNQGGLRADKEYSIEPLPAVRRLAAFGDSFTHCDEVEFSDCWTSELERDWPGTEVLNFGVPGYSPDQAWLRYRRERRAYRPCAVLIGYMVENINRVVTRFFPFYQPETGIVLGKPRFLLDGDGLALLPNPATTPEPLDDPRWAEAALGPRDRWYFPGTFVANPLDAFHLVRVVRTAAYHRHVRGLDGFDTRFLRAYGSGAAWGGMGTLEAFDEQLARAYRGDQEAYRVAERVLIGFARDVLQDGATPVVIVFGRRQEAVSVRREQGKMYASLLDSLAREHVATIDVTDRLARESRRVGMEQLFGSSGHYTRAVNQIVGSELARELPRLTSPTCAADPDR
jgi:hypothetical protein